MSVCITKIAVGGKMANDKWTGFKANGKTDRTGVYLIKSNVSEEVYVGSTKDMAKRIRQHKYELRHNKHPCKKLQEIYNKSPELTVEFIEIDEPDKTLARELAFDQEQSLLDKFKEQSLLLNAATDARNAATGIDFTDEVRGKMSAAAKRRFKDPATVERVSQNSRDRWSNQEYRDKLTELRNTPEHKLLQSEHKKQLWKNPEHRAKICIPVIADGKKYDSLKDAAKDLGISTTVLRYRCNSKNFPNYSAPERGKRNE